MKFNKNKYLAVPPVVVYLHLGFWALFISAELSVLFTLSHKAEPVRNYVVYYSINLGLFYSQLWLFHQKTGTAKAILIKLTAFIGLILIYLLFKYTADYFLAVHRKSWSPMSGHRHAFLANTLYRGGYFIFLAAFYWAAGHLSAYSRRAKAAEQQQLLIRAEAEKQLAEARVAYLQQQLNPHLLFNALNFIYTSVYRHSEAGARCVELLSEIMRFSLSGTGPDGKAALADELEQLTNLVELNAARFDEPLRLRLRIEGEPGDHRIIPLILLTLTENIFKHGHLLDPACPAELRVHTDGDNRLTYYSRNRKKAKSGAEPVSRIGLRNARIRLDHAYGKDYALQITETAELFELTLTLPV